MRRAKHYTKVRDAHIALVEAMLDRVRETSAAEIVSKTGIRRAKVNETLRTLIAEGRAHKSSGHTRSVLYRSGPVPAPDAMSTSAGKRFVYGGMTIRFDGKYMDATAMWRACGSPIHLDPTQWLRHQSTKSYVAKLSEKLIMCNTHNEDIQVVRKIKGGTNPHTEMHELLALKYAQDLRPDFAIECNRFLLAWGRGEVRTQGGVSRGELIALEHRMRLQIQNETNRAILEISTPMRIALVELRNFFTNLNPFRA